jgi:2-polyprenyl-3-methyl-5-hydroxy-6-metoxy-1,4-benzoquinol methylase
MMEATGERFIPELNGEIKYEHLHRYALALDFIKGRAVLDIASGEGYGTAILAKSAGSVIGVDIDPEAVNHAQVQYASLLNLKFLVGSCSAIPLADASIDVVTSFETIEHHDQHEEMMQEIKRVLKPDGVLLISSPNRLVYSDVPQYVNPFHIKELYYEEFIGLLRQSFHQVYVYGQKLAVGSWVTPLEPSNTSKIKIYAGDSNALYGATVSLQDPMYFIAICSNNVNPFSETLESAYIDSADDVFMKLRVHQQNIELALQSTQQAVQEQQRHLGSAHQQLEATQQQFGATHQQLEAAQQQFGVTQQELRVTQQELGTRQQELEAMQQELEAMQQHTKAMESSKFWKLRVLWMRLKQYIALKI